MNLLVRFTTGVKETSLKSNSLFHDQLTQKRQARRKRELA